MFFQFRHICNGFLLCCRQFFAGSGAEKNIFGMRCRIRFLMDSAAAENLSSAICVFSNDVGCDGGFLFVGCLYGRKTQRVLYQARSFVPSK